MRSGLWDGRVGWLQRQLRNGRRAWSPGSIQDSLLVGSSRYDKGGPEEATRLFFDKTTGAFRAGTAIGSQWDTLGVNSVALGANSSATGPSCVAIGNGATASGVSNVAIGEANVSSATNYSIAMGKSSTASGNYAIALTVGGSASGTSSVAMGDTATASGDFAIAVGRTVSATASYATATGGYSSAVRLGQHAHSGTTFGSNGDAQASRFVMRAATSGTTATELALDGGTAYLTIPNIRTMSFHIKVAAHRTDVSGTAAAWPLITGGITRDATGNCRLLGSITGAGTTSLCDAGASTWSVAVTADSTNNRLAVTVTGEAAKTIRWVASVEMVEVG